MTLFFTSLLFNYFVGSTLKRKKSKFNYWETVKYEPPSFKRNVQMHSRHGHYISINKKGQVQAVWDPHSPDGKNILLMSFLHYSVRE